MIPVATNRKLLLAAARSVVRRRKTSLRYGSARISSRRSSNVVVHSRNVQLYLSSSYCCPGWRRIVRSSTPGGSVIGFEIGKCSTRLRVLSADDDAIIAINRGFFHSNNRAALLARTFLNDGVKTV